jgi:hypothetical protein
MAPPAQRGARRQIEGEAHVWTGSGWERVAKLERRLQKLHGLIRYNDEMGGERLAAQFRADAAHVRALLAGPDQ